MKSDLRAYQHEFEERGKTEDVECLWTTIKKKLHSLMDEYISSKMLRGDNIQKSWKNSQVNNLRRKQKILFRRQRKTGAAKDIRHYRETKARPQKAKRQSYWKYLDNLIEIRDPSQEHQPNQKMLFIFIKSLRRDNSGIALLKEHGRLHDDPKQVADILNQQYESTRSKEDQEDLPIPDDTPYPSMADINATKEGVLRLLLK